jgi:hypothetical protein
MPVEGASSSGWKRGDLVRVHLKIEAQTDMTWVVVNDPIPAGASHLGTGLSRDSAIATSGEKIDTESFVWPIYSERAFRFPLIRFVRDGGRRTHSCWIAMANRFTS